MGTLRRAGDGYRVLRGVNWPNPNRKGQEKRAEPGEIVTDLPAGSIAELLAIGAIEPADTAEVPRARARKPRAPKPELPVAIPSGGLPPEER